jgi:NAD(P)H-hydrate epimerase
VSEVRLNRNWARKVDELAVDQYGMSGLQLMENAGRGCADLLERLGIAGPVAICCGKGNNAGDGFVIARHLESRGYKVKLLLWCQPSQLHGDAAFNYEIARRADIRVIECDGREGTDWLVAELRGVDWVVDALLGTGSSGAPRPPLDAVIRILNKPAAKRFAVDLPSGLDCDTGVAANPTFRANHTATFVAEKIGFQKTTAKPYLGVVHRLDIGVPRKLLQEIFAQSISS